MLTRSTFSDLSRMWGSREILGLETVAGLCAVAGEKVEH